MNVKPFFKGAKLKGKNLLSGEQILVLKSTSEANQGDYLWVPSN